MQVVERCQCTFEELPGLVGPVFEDRQHAEGKGAFARLLPIPQGDVELRGLFEGGPRRVEPAGEHLSRAELLQSVGDPMKIAQVAIDRNRLLRKE